MFWVLKRTVSLSINNISLGWKIRKLVFRYTLFTKVLDIYNVDISHVYIMLYFPCVYNVDITHVYIIWNGLFK